MEHRGCWRVAVIPFLIITVGLCLHTYHLCGDSGIRAAQGRPFSGDCAAANTTGARVIALRTATLLATANHRSADIYSNPEGAIGASTSTNVRSAHELTCRWIR